MIEEVRAGGHHDNEHLLAEENGQYYLIDMEPGTDLAAAMERMFVRFEADPDNDVASEDVRELAEMCEDLLAVEATPVAT